MGGTNIVKMIMLPKYRLNALLIKLTLAYLTKEQEPISDEAAGCRNYPIRSLREAGSSCFMAPQCTLSVYCGSPAD